MATELSPSIQWLPDDDLELKNAIERGASLEALAKGAGQFSQRFSLRELQDRWHSLLYDPGVSAQASSHMFELEISKLNRSDISLIVNKEVPQKRKSESLRRKYYAMRKKYRSDILSNADLGFFEPSPQFTEYVASGFQKQAVLGVSSLGQSSMIGDDNISELLGLPVDDLDFRMSQAFPDTVRDIGGTSGTANFIQAECLNSFEENHTNERIENYGFGEDISSLKQGGNEMMVANIRSRENPLFSDNMINEDPNSSCVRFVDEQIFEPSNPEDFATFQADMFASDQLPMRHCRALQDVSVTAVPVGTDTGDTAKDAQGVFNDIEGKENSSSVYTGESADPDSLLNLSVGNEILVDLDIAEDNYFTDKVESGSIIVAETNSVPLTSAHPAVQEVVPLLIHGDQQINVHPESNASVKLVSESEFSEPCAEKICCTLNTQSTEIPCNDDIFLLIHPSATFCTSAPQPNTITSNDASAGSHEKYNEQAVIKGSTKGFGCSQKITSHGLSDSNTIHPFVGRAAKTEMHNIRPQPPIRGFANKTITDSNKGISLYPIPKGSHDRMVVKNVAGFPMRVGGRPTTVTGVLQSTEAESVRIVHQEILDEYAVFDQEESEIEDDVPYFSDVEAMLFDMDLDPVEHDSQVKDSQIIQQVPSYQHDETKRTIIRLEQASRSCLHRAMTSKGALAIFYGRHLRHCINKPEVLLGRSTDDIDVDIDLRKEGRANKISRRQATIKLEEDGSFSIQNLGKSSVSVKGRPVSTGQFLTLSSGCLIEIGGMSFVFEINKRYLKQNLGKFIDKIRGRTSKPDNQL